jgi:hypothetical protein
MIEIGLWTCDINFYIWLTVKERLPPVTFMETEIVTLQKQLFYLNNAVQDVLRVQISRRSADVSNNNILRVPIVDSQRLKKIYMKTIGSM